MGDSYKILYAGGENEIVEKKSRFIATLRPVNSEEEAAAFLEQEQRLTYSPFLMADMDKAAARVQQALADGEKIAVFGDYDVDGITATCILVDYLQSRGADVLHYIPRRIEDGYGLSCDAIEGLYRKGARLLITVRHHRRGGGGLRQLPGHGRGHHRPP